MLPFSLPLIDIVANPKSILNAPELVEVALMDEKYNTSKRKALKPIDTPPERVLRIQGRASNIA